MSIHPDAGKKATAAQLVDVAALERAYYDASPDLDVVEQRIQFGTSGHRGSSLSQSFCEAHILACTQAICDYRRKQGIDGPLFVGKDSHALSGPAERTAVEVLLANEVDTVVHEQNRLTPTPVISHSILNANRGKSEKRADGIVITPSHNPPADGGFKYNPPHGGPAETEATAWIEKRANELLSAGVEKIAREPYEAARRSNFYRELDLITPYVTELERVVRIDAIRDSGLRIGVHPLGGAALEYWMHIAERFGLNMVMVSTELDPQFAFMTLDHDGKIRMDCSSPFAMASLLECRKQYDIAFGNDPDADRHGIVTPEGLMNPNEYLAVALDYLCAHRPQWPKSAAVGKTVVTSSILERIAQAHQRAVFEVPVGFKWYGQGLFDGSLVFGGEESAGASFLRLDGSAWSTDKDGIIMNLLAAELSAVTGKNPAQYFDDLAQQHGRPHYTRIDAPANHAQKSLLKKLSPQSVRAATLAGDPIVGIQTKARGNEESIGGLRVETNNGWFAARPSGTEDIYKIYAESFQNEQHLKLMVSEAQAVVAQALGAAA